MRLISRDALYLYAAIPAFYLPLTYIVLILWTFYEVFTGGKMIVENNSIIYSMGLIGIIGTFIQWPIYISWAIFSKELTLRLKVLWIVVLILLNMLAIPLFLYCKYKRMTHSALIKNIRNEKVKAYFEKGVNSV